MTPLLRPLEELIAAWRESAESDTAKMLEMNRQIKAGEVIVVNSCSAYSDPRMKCSDDLERVLRESGLSDLLEAGQAMRHATYASSMIEAHHKWDAGLAALAKVKGKSA